MTDQPSSTKEELRAQWTNPADVLSLLLLIGGDIVQKVIAQLIGRTIQPFKGRNLEIGISPVAFSFGWVAYAFTNLLSAVGEKQLMPTADQQSVVEHTAAGNNTYIAVLSCVVDLLADQCLWAQRKCVVPGWRRWNWDAAKHPCSRRGEEAKCVGLSPYQVLASTHDYWETSTCIERR